MTINILLLLLGFVLLIKGADWMVDGASSLAKKFNISDLAIGLTVVAFGTSAPELVVNIIASIENHSAIVFGNVIGSNNFNTFMILGVAGLITPMVVQSSTVWKEIPFSLAAVFILFLFGNDFFLSEVNTLSRIDGIILLALFVGFLYYVYKQLKSEPGEIQVETHQYSNTKIWGLIIIGLTGLVVGGQLVVENAVEIAITAGMSQKLVGLTIIAAGTSLPELATSVVAALKKNNDIAVGNIIGSNIFNIFLILGLSSVINPLQYDVAFNTDIYLLMGGTILLFIAMFTGKKHKLDRWEAALLLITFLIYTGFLISNEM
jgi:cation:H+ antiporter